ncbi:MAG: succinylglutamate desuccinylase/aspartoacylase family protein [Bacteroidetes bacterium]|nr:succinylglutamate desuccinylase/aspartoacylase family protein [Bacteroidota bacterium]
MHKDIVINGHTIKPGQFLEANLNTYRLPTRTFIEIPVHVFRSIHTGPTALFIAGMHGDEINGIEILRRLIRQGVLQKLVKGSVIVIPIINIVSFISGSRELPDGRDLNRCFPGTQSGSLGSRMAYDLMKEIVPQIDFGVDFHTGGAQINNFPQTRCVFDDEQSLAYANMFSAPFTLNSPYRDKTFRKEASKKGKSILVYEAGESMRFNSLAINEGIKGCLRLLKQMEMLDTNVEERETKLLKESKWVRARMAGLFATHKRYGSSVTKGEVIGYIADPYGDTEIQLKAPESGYIVGVNNQPVINEGDALIHIGVE